MVKPIVDAFSWKVGAPPPKIEPHSERKLAVIERYLQVYFDTVVRDPRMDNLNITFVDGFCGGGMYAAKNGPRTGSPMSILNGVFEAAVKLNQGRQKPIRIDASYHFGDESRDHIEHLAEVLRTSQFGENVGRNIHLHNSSFVEVLPRIIAEIRSRQTKGRSIFLLDQFGYSDVPMAAIKSIFESLPRAEIILTFSIDALLNYLQVERDPLPVVRQFGVDEAFLRQWSIWKQDARSGRAMAQRALMQQIHSFSGARFFTPFMLFSTADNRHMMIAHLSQSQTARDKMLSVHWELNNTFRHIGRGSLFELGYDVRLENDDSLFAFSDMDRGVMRRELENELPERIFDLSRAAPLAVGGLLDAIGNKTAATNIDISETLRRLSGQREIEILNRGGGLKRPGAIISPTDSIRMARQMRLFSL